MWIVDCPVKQGGPQICSYVISKKGKSYIFGSKKGNLKGLDIPIITELVISRRQLEFKLDSINDWILAQNIGSRSMYLRRDGEKDCQLLAAKSPDYETIKRNSVFYKKDSDSIIELKLKKINIHEIFINKRVNDILGDELVTLFGFNVNVNLTNDEIILNGKISRIKDVDSWMNILLKCKWKTEGGLDGYLIPEVENCEIIEIPATDDDDGLSDHEIISPPPPPPPMNMEIEHKINDDNNFVSMDPPLYINSQISQGTQIKTESQQQESLLGLIMADDEELRLKPRRRKTKKKNVQESQIKDTPPPIIEIKNDEIVELNKDMDNLSVKKRTPEELPHESKRAKIEKKPTTSLVENIIKAREMKLERIKKDNELMEIGSKINVKVSKFQIKLTSHGESTLFQTSNTFDKPEWENRVNFSKFQKRSMGYNPVMDSTIQYITMKSSKYNSTTAQCDATRHEYLFENENIPVFDNEFGDSNSNSNGRGAYANKRTRNTIKPSETGPSLFVPSEDESEDDTQFISRGSSSRVERQSTITESFSKRKTTPPKIKMSILSEEDNSEDDDVPVFKAQKRY